MSEALVPVYGDVLGLSGTTKAVTSVARQTGTLSSVFSRGWFRIVESFAGAWQRNVDVSLDNVTTHPTLFACVTLIASTIAKMRMRLVQELDGIWVELQVASFSPVLRKPNGFQNQQQFYEFWALSKLLNGNTYVLKVRDKSRDVMAMYVLDPSRVRPLISPNGDVFYQLGKDDLNQLPDAQGYVVPATEIIHDRWNCMFHGLVGLSPIYACGVAAVQGLNIQNSSTSFFGNGSMPGGVLTAPGAIDQPTADRLKAYFDESFSGDNAGKVAILGDGLHYEPMAMTAAASQLVEQLKWSDEKIASAYHMPLFMVSSASYPPYNTVVALQTMFYSMCVQSLAEAIENCLDEGLGLTDGAVASNKYGTEFNRDDLFTMDLVTLMQTLEKGKNYYTPNDGRKRLGLRRVPGGDDVYRQQQDFSLRALQKRDAKEDPFAKSGGRPAPSAPPSTEPAAQKALDWQYRAFGIATRQAEAFDFSDSVAA